MKNFSHLTKKERVAYINSHRNNLGKEQPDLAEVQYIIENNTPEEIAYWLKHQATTTIYPGTPADWICSVKQFNRLYAFCNEKGLI